MPVGAPRGHSRFETCPAQDAGGDALARRGTNWGDDRPKEEDRE